MIQLLAKKTLFMLDKDEMFSLLKSYTVV